MIYNIIILSYMYFKQKQFRKKTLPAHDSCSYSMEAIYTARIRYYKLIAVGINVS